MRIGFPFLLLILAGGAQAAPSSSPGEAYAERAARLEGKKDAKAWLKLADFAEEQLLMEKREEALRKAVGIDPKNVEARERLNKVRVGREWLPAEAAEAREAAEKQARGLVRYGEGWIEPGEADTLREADRKEVGWPLEYRLDTPHLRIYSAQPLPLTRRVAAILEDEVGVYQGFYGKTFTLDPEPPPFRVFVFRDLATLTRIVARDDGFTLPDGAVGYYAPRTKVLYVGVSETGDSEACVLSTAVHEMTHALDDLAAHVHHGLPPWLQEGRADHLGYSLQGRRILPGATAIPVDVSILEDLAKAIDGADLRDLMGLDQEGFMGEAALEHYALAWAWVHFLFHAEGGKHAPGFRSYLQGIPGKAAPADFEAAVGPLSGLEPAFKRYVKKALIPGATYVGQSVPGRK